MEQSGRRLAENGMAYGYLPSYREATEPPDWLELVAPHVPVGDYARLCLVSRRFYHQFAPRLWNDPLTALVLLKRDDNDPESFHRFLKHAAAAPARPETLALVACLDLRRFAANTSDLPLYASDKQFPDALRSLPSMFTRLRCILLDGHPGFESGALVSALGSDPPLSPNLEPPLLLSIAQCQAELPTSFFASPYLRSLVYLDVSDLPGSLKSALVQRTLSPANLLSLRILKARGREVDNTAASLLFRAFRDQLWSIDLSGNRLTDGIFDDMHQFSFPSQNVRTGSFAVDGQLSCRSEGSEAFGEFCFVNESQWSATFSHPHRHLVDAPLYHPQDDPRPLLNPRLDGRVRVRPNSVGKVKAMLCGGIRSRSPSLEHIHGLDICRGHQGITHLFLNGIDISATALARMIRRSPGQLQHLECDSLSFKLHEAATLSWLPKARLSGLLGSAHVFRPVFSANLQVLRIHHSLVTQLLSVEIEGLPSVANLWVAETHLLPRAQLAYPEAFVPDMNPRLQSLVLTRIPRYSTGPLIEKLVNFLKLASIQERAIQDIQASGRHSPANLLGLRHIRLEFEPDPRGELGHGSELEFDVDPAKVMDESTGEFSFFGDSAWAFSKPSPSPSSTAGATPTTTITAATAVEKHLPEPQPSHNNSDPPQSARLADSSTNPFSEPESPYLLHTWSWNAAQITVPVWIGPDPGIATALDNPTPAVREYMRLLRAHPALRTHPVPASPCNVAAGVPAGKYVFSAAWEAILAPSPLPPPLPRVLVSFPRWDNRSGSTAIGGKSSGNSSSRSSTGATPNIPQPTRTQLRSMRDVVAAVKEYRANTRKAYEEARRKARENQEEVKLGEPHFNWTGKLEVLLEEHSGMGCWR